MNPEGLAPDDSEPDLPEEFEGDPPAPQGNEDEDEEEDCQPVDLLRLRQEYL